MKHFNSIMAALVAILIVSAIASATDMARVPSSLQFGGQAIQVFAPDGSTTTTLTVASKTVDLSNYIMYGIESGSGTTCYFRLMPTSTKTGTQTLLRVAGTRIERAKNLATPFLNMSGCTGGSYSLQ